MPRTFPRLKVISLCLLAHAGLAFAQQQQQPAQQPPSDKPPRLERIEPGSDVPATTLPPRGRTQIKEKKVGGQVTEVEVRSGKSHYILKPNVPAGNAVVGDVESSGIRPPQWQVFEFDLNAKKKAASAAAAAAAAEGAAAPAEAPPPAPAQK